MICFVPIVCLSIRKSCQRRDCSELGNVRNWVDHCTATEPLVIFATTYVVVLVFLRFTLKLQAKSRGLETSFKPKVSLHFTLSLLIWVYRPFETIF